MRKFTNMILLAAMLLATLAGCVPSVAAPTAAPQTEVASTANSGNPSEQTTLNVILPANVEGQLLKTFIPDFESKYGIKVVVTDVPVDTLDTKITVELESGTGTTDVFGFPYEWIPKFSANLLPIDSYVSDQDKNDIDKYAFDSASYNGKLMGLMYTVTGMIMFYRTDLLAQAGLQPPTTWDEYLADAQKLTANDVYGTIVTAKLAEEPVGMFLNYLYQNGGDIIDDNGKVIINNEAGVEALQFMVDLVHKYKVAPEAAPSYTTVETTNLFKEGKIALAPNWSYMWSASQADDSPVKGKVGMALLPGNKKQGISLGGWTLSINAKTKNADAAYKFINFLTDTEHQKIMAVQLGNTPSRKSALESAEVKAIPLFDVMAGALETSVPRSKYPHFDQISNEISIALSGAVAQTGTAKDLLDTAAANIEKIISQ